jgi:hypothetical protein
MDKKGSVLMVFVYYRGGFRAITFTPPGLGFKHRFFQQLVWGGQKPL